MYTHQYERERAMRGQEAYEDMIRMREPRRSPHPDPLRDHALSAMATIEANLDNEALDDAAFREFVRRTIR